MSVTVPYSRRRRYVQPYFDQGVYLFEIEGATLNGAGDPAINMRVLESFDGRRVGVYYFRNFHLTAATSEKSRALWDRKFDMLLSALGIQELNDLGVLVGRTVLVGFTKAGLEPLPNFLSPEARAKAPPTFTTELAAA